MSNAFVASNSVVTSGMSPEETAQATGHSLSLVQEYLDLIEEFRLPRLPSSHGKGDSHL